MSDKVTYKVTIKTGDVPDADTDSEVYLYFIGETGETPKLIPPQNSKNFKRAVTADFSIPAVDVGPLTGLRIGHSNKKTFFFGNSGWFLDYVVVEKGGESYHFPCGKWLDDSKEDNKTERTLKAGRRINYKIAITTSDEKGAGTDANVTICLYGKNGETGARALETDKDNFERGKTDTFYIEAEDIGPLQKIKIGHDGKESVKAMFDNSAWKCERITIEDPKRGSYTFEINEWFSKETKLYREYEVNKAKLGTYVTYTIEITTGNIRGAGTSAQVFAILYGEKRNSGKILLENSPKNFTRGAVDTFPIESEELGEITKVTIGHDNSGWGADWFLQNVTVKNDLIGKEWHFGCGRWLSDSQDDKLTIRDLLQTDFPARATTYEVKVKTGDIRGSGTDANVFIIIHGPGMDTGRRKLDNHWNNFETGQTDTFAVESIDVGAINSITIGHDNTGLGPGWFLDWVKITNSADGKSYSFPAGLWFALEEDDGSLVRTIQVSEGELSSASLYQVSVITGDRRGAGTDANVSIQVYGKKGQSRKQRLDTGANNFERGKTDVFGLQCPRDLGEITKIRIGHDNSGFGPGWYLDKVIIKNLKTEVDTFFLAGRWLAKDEGDGSIEIEIPASSADGQCGVPLTTYKVTVYTGDRPGAGTDANVFITLFGEESDSGDRQLENDLNNFERNKIDVFSFKCVDLGTISKIRIRHDGSGFGSAWFLDKIVVSSGTGRVWYFLYGKWLDSDKGLSAEIEGSEADGVASLPLVTYRIDVVTGDRRGAGTDSNVSIELYGENGRSGSKTLDGPGNLFERNQTDTFGIECIDIGKIGKIRIGHDNSGFGPAWFLEKVIVTSEKTKEKYYFMCGDWLEKDHSQRELPAVGEDGQASVPLVPYKIEVTTGDRFGAGTDANVFIVLNGDNMDSGKHILDGPGNKFERKKTDTFGFECVDLGNIKKILIGHDNSGFGASWFLDKVVVTNEKTKQQWFFLLGKWLSKDEGDGAIEREIPASSADGVASLPLVSYKISVLTGDRRGAGTDANVFITVFGTTGDSGDRKLENSGNNFERNSTDVFGIDCVDLGDLKRVIIRHDNSGIGPGWFLDKVIIESGKGERWYFPCGQWLAQDEEDKQISRELGAIKEDVSTYAPWMSYLVEVFTGDRPGAGTDAQVSIELRGEKGRSGLRVLDNSQDNFERNKCDVFGIQTADLGAIKEIEIGHDNSGFGGAWFLDKVIVTSEKTQQKWFFLFGNWLKGSQNRQIILSSDKDGNPSLPLIPYKIEVTTGDRKGAGTDANVSIVLYGENSDSGKRFLDGSGNLFERNKTDTFSFKMVDLGELKKIIIGHDNSGFGPGWFLDKVVVTNEKTGQKWFFLAGTWLDKSEGDGAIQRELPASTEDGKASAPMVTYVVKVITGDRKGAGTDANVFITIFGSEGDSGERQLDSSDDNFERNKIDVFGIECVDLGQLERIVIRHDNKGVGPGWFLDKVIIESGTGSRWYFPCGRWLSDDEDDKQILREIAAIKEDIITYAPLVNYKVTVYTGDRPGAGTDAAVYITLVGEKKSKSQEFHLENGLSNFRRGGNDVFGLQTIYIGPLTKINVRLGPSGFRAVGAAWFLDKIIIHSEKDNTTYYFLAGDWINKKSHYTREIPAGTADGQTYLPMVTYTISVLTGSCRGAGTDANVFAILYGENGDSGRQVLDGPGNKFERNQTDVFQIVCVDLGQITKIRVGHDGSGIGAGWFCESIKVESSKGEKFDFPCRRWFDSSQGDRQIERDLMVDGVPGLGMVKYRITVVTGNHKGSGTDANVFLSLLGNHGSVDKVRLDNASNNFETGRVDVFEIETLDLGELKQAIISHDNSGIGPGWFLDKIFVLNHETKQRWTFPCNRWLDRNEDDHKIERLLVPGASGRTTLLVRVFTGKVKGAGTDSKVHVYIHGDKGKTGKIELKNSDHSNKFEEGQIDTFALDVEEVGKIDSLTIGHDNTGLGSEWFLDQVEVTDQATGDMFTFPCNKWFDKKKGDGLLERTLKVG